MSSLHIVVGYDTSLPSARCFPVYVGRSGAESLAAQERSAAARFEIFKSVHGIRKNNPRAQANAARLQALAAAERAAAVAASEAAADPAVLADLRAQLSAAREELALTQRNLTLAEDAYRAQSVRIDAALAAAAAVPPPSPAAEPPPAPAAPPTKAGKRGS